MNNDRLQATLRAFDAANSRDPRAVEIEGQSCPFELHYASRLAYWVEQLAPEASEPLRLAARCQHIERWTIPRERYPAGRRGYLQWREDLKHFHASRSAEILKQAGYPQQLIERVQQLNLKKNLKTDVEVQVLEDALCLVFLEEQLHDFASRTDREKVISILRKTWIKMSPQGQRIALRLPLPDKDRELIEQALRQRQ